MPTLALPVSWLPTLTIMVPRKDAPLAADVEQAKVFAGFFSRDDLGKVAAAQCLRAALEHAHQHGQYQNCHWLVRKKANTAMPV